MNTAQTTSGSEHGEWAIRFSARTSQLDCRHGPSRARIRGALTFVGQEDGGLSEWTIAGPAPGEPERLRLIAPDGLCQGYVVFRAAGPCLWITAVERALLSYKGTLVFEARASLGSRTFACRTRPPRGCSRVVQMASGPADSGLNDSLFDIDRDTVLRFDASRMRITTRESADNRRPAFCIHLQADAHDAALAGIELEVLDGYYRSRYAPWYRPLNKKRWPTAPTGWMSWNVYFDKAGEVENLAEARIGAKYLAPYGLRIWSIESWQDNSGSQPVRNFANLTLRPFAEQFPHGMKWLADRIRELGLIPGIWSVPFGTGDDAFYREHRSWFLHDASGKPLSNWCGRYLLDPSQPAARRYVCQTYQTMAEQWGYEFFKIDGMSAWSAGYSNHFYEQPHVQAAFRRKCRNPYQLLVGACRRGIGPDRFLLACAGQYSSPDAGIAEAARIGRDVVGLNQAPQWQNTMNQLTTSLANLFTNNILWYTDPDTLLVGSYAPVDTARIAATVVALPGQFTFAGDKLAELPAERMWLLQRCLPTCDVRPLDLFPIHEPRDVWTLKVRRPFACWDVVSVFNLGEEQQEMAVPLADLGLDADVEYLAYEFWSQRLLGTVHACLRVQVQPRSNALIALHPAEDRPQFLSSNRHLTQGAVSLRALSWNANACTLAGTVELVAGEQTILTFHVPGRYTFCRAVASSHTTAECRVVDNETLRLTLRSVAAGDADWELTFEPER